MMVTSNPPAVLFHEWWCFSWIINPAKQASHETKAARQHFPVCIARLVWQAMDWQWPKSHPLPFKQRGVLLSTSSHVHINMPDALSLPQRDWKAFAGKCTCTELTSKYDRGGCIDLFMRGPRSLCLSLDILVCGGAQAPVGCDGVRLAASMKSGWQTSRLNQSSLYHGRSLRRNGVQLWYLILQSTGLDLSSPSLPLPSFHWLGHQLRSKLCLPKIMQKFFTSKRAWRPEHLFIQTWQSHSHNWIKGHKLLWLSQGHPSIGQQWLAPFGRGVVGSRVQESVGTCRNNSYENFLGS